MGVYIKGMDMPKSFPLVVVIDAAGTARRYDLNNDRYADNELFEANYIPPHGKLIDRDDLKNKEVTFDYNEWDDTFDDGLLFVTDLIDNAPTIIEAEKGKNTNTWPEYRT